MIKHEPDKVDLSLEVLEQVRARLFNQELPENPKTRAKKEIFLLKLPLFHTIYQKRGDSNFQLIIDHIKLVKEDFGATVFDNEDNRTFNFILRGTVMLFTRTVKDDKKMAAKLFKKLGVGEYFGEKMQFGKEELQSARCASLCYLLQMDMRNFYFTFAGHFQCEELRDKVNFLKEVWLFNKMGRQTLEKILLTSEQKQFVRGSVLFRQKQSATHLFLIFDGQITLETQEEGRNKPFCVLTRAQIYGIQEIAEERDYDSTGICTSDYCELLLIPKQIVQKHFLKDSFPSMIQLRKNLSKQLKNNSSTQRCLQSVNALRQQNSRTFNTQIRRYSHYDNSRRVKTEADLKNAAVSKIQALNQLFDREVQLKHEELRRYRLEFIKDAQNRTLYSTKRISSYVNKDCTYDKEIILKYLQRKERIYHSALKKQLQYQSKKIVFIPELKVDRSSAVKNQKRKLKNSRRINYSQSVL